MQIVSYIVDSFQEYEGEHSLVLFSKGCNIDCYFCYNKDKMNGASIGDAIELIDKLITPLHTAVVLCGGEPTIWHDLPEVCKHIKEKGLKCKVFTNGLRFTILEESIRFIDFISIDFKCINRVGNVLNTRMSDNCYIEVIFQLINDVLLPFEIRTTFFNGMSIEELEEIKSLVKEWTKDNPFFTKHIIQDDFRDNLKIKMEKLGE